MGRSVDSPAAAAPVRSPALEATRRLVESVVVAVVTSTGVYLVGTVYTEAYYGRMSIDATALDLPPPYIALQAVHALQSLLAYPALLLVFYWLYRVGVARLPRVRSWTGRQFQRLGRLAVLLGNGLIVLALIWVAGAANANPGLIQTTSTLSEVVSLMQFTALCLLVYAVWLSLGPCKLLLAELQQRRLLPIALLAALYLLGALDNTAARARANAERLMTGASDTSMAVTFTWAAGVTPLPRADLLLVALRNGHYFVVERQPDPPSRTPIAYAVPFRAVDSIRLERVNPAAPAAEGIVVNLDAIRATPAP